MRHWKPPEPDLFKTRGDTGVRALRCTEHFPIMAFAQITYRENLRDIGTCLGAQPAPLCRNVIMEHR
jgi:hypothetical protein